ncbi:MAG: hypothetical protein V2A65_05155 [Candidatus Omnitrophota bacterium]
MREKEFHLGRLLTEQTHPLTVNLSYAAQQNPLQGLKQILSVDFDIVKILRKTDLETRVEKVTEEIISAIQNGRHIIFTGCGATGRLAILVDSVWRRFWRNLKKNYPDLIPHFPGFENITRSVMAGGDFALIKSVEGYEDFADFGKRQIRDTGLSAGDLVFAVTEGGETSFVIGTARAGLESGAKVYFVYNNPDRMLMKFSRCRDVLSESRIQKLCLATGPMAITGSTRMQAVTTQLAVIGVSLEIALYRLLQKYILAKKKLPGLGTPVRKFHTWTDEFSALLKSLHSESNLQELTRMALFEKEIYQAHGLITYLADTYALDLLTDTTERSPTFLVPSFIRRGDQKSPPSWSFVIRPETSNRTAWFNLLQRDFNDVRWYKGLSHKLDRKEILRYDLRRNSLKERLRGPSDGFVLFLVGDEFEHQPEILRLYQDLCRKHRKKTERFGIFFLGTAENYKILRKRLATMGITSRVFPVIIPPGTGYLKVTEHLAFKICLNSVSTLTMVLLGRVLGNCMIYVFPGNKKLYDRATRYVARMTGKSYAESCDAVFRATDYVKKKLCRGEETGAPVLLAAVCLMKKCPIQKAEELLRNRKDYHTLFPRLS